MRKGSKQARRQLTQVSQSFGNGVLGMSDKLPFGMYTGSVVSNVLESHPDYIAWWDANVQYPKLSDMVTDRLAPAYTGIGYDDAVEQYGMDAIEW